jgi:hypothetical protein
MSVSTDARHIISSVSRRKSRTKETHGDTSCIQLDTNKQSARPEPLMLKMASFVMPFEWVTGRTACATFRI